MLTKWPRYIHASMNKHFKTALDKITCWFEGDDKDFKLPEFVECKVIGPAIKMIAKKQYKITAEFTAQVTVQKGNDLYRVHDIAGILLDACTSMVIFNYDRDTDNPVAQFCMTPIDTANMMFIGQQDPKVNVLQAIVTCRYHAEVTEE